MLDFPAFGIQLVTRQWGIPFMLQAWYLFVICSIVHVTVSLLTSPPETHRVEKYCWKSPWAVIMEKEFSGPTDPRLLALLLVIVMACCFYLFA